MYRGGLYGALWVPLIRGEKVAFSCLQQAGEHNFSSSYPGNPERTIKGTPVVVSRGICHIRIDSSLIVKYHYAKSTSASAKH